MVEALLAARSLCLLQLEWRHCLFHLCGMDHTAHVSMPYDQHMIHSVASSSGRKCGCPHISLGSCNGDKAQTVLAADNTKDIIADAQQLELP